MRVRGGNHYLYRAVDKHGQSVDSLLCAGRDRAAAQAFFEHAVMRSESGWPGKVNVDGHAATHLALRLLGKKDRRWRSVQMRSNRYLNNIVEQDHRAIRRRCASMLGLKSFRTAAITFAGIELAHRIRKRQFWVGSDRQDKDVSLKHLWDLALACGSGCGRMQSPAAAVSPLMHQNSRGTIPMLTDAQIRDAKPLRCARKVTDGRGLYLLVTPNGGKYWRFNYHFEGKRKTVAYGVYPDVALEKARARHQWARSLLSDGVDPSGRKRELRNAQSPYG